MQIQINDPQKQISDELFAQIEDSVADALRSHAERLTRVEVHVQDLNAQKGGVDKRCMIEARPRGLDPVAADHSDEGVRDAFRGALEKIQRVLERRFGKLSSRREAAE